MSAESDAHDSKKILSESCKWGSPAVILLSDDATRLEGRFYRVLDNAEVIQLQITSFGQIGSLGDIRLGQYCGVTFVHRDRPFFFLGTITDHFVEDKRPLVEFPLAVVVRAEMRRTYRVPVLDKSLRAQVVFEDENVFEPLVKNISLTGALIEFDLENDPKLFPYDKIALKLIYLDEVEVSLRGVVRRCDIEGSSRRYGVLFPETSGIADPPDELVQICQHVERLWLGDEGGES